MDFISIIMAAYNAESTLSQAVDSVLRQTYTSFELLIVDDCSKDRTGEMADEYAKIDSRVRVIHNAENRGVSQTRLIAAQQAKGDWIAILDSDDAWEADKLEKQCQLQAETGARVLFTGSSFMAADGSPKNWILHVPEKITYRDLLRQNLISNSSALVSRELYLQNYATGDEMHEDFAMWLQILRTGMVAYGLDEPLLCYRLSSTSKTGNKWRSAKMNWRTYRYVGLNPFTAAYYMCWYAINGLRKYKNLQ